MPLSPLQATILRWLIVAIAFIFLVSILNFWLAVRPFKYRSANTPSAFSLPSENVSFTTSDGLTLRGWFIPHNTSKATVIVLHGYPFDKGNILPLAAFLHKELNILLYDSRYFGESDGRYTTVGWHERKDLEAAIAYLRGRKGLDQSQIGIMGFSLGAATALMAHPPEIKAYVLDSGYASADSMLREMYFIFPGPLKWPFVQLTKLYARLFLGIRTEELAPEKAIGGIKAPALIIHGGEDSQISVENAHKLYEAAEKKMTELWIVEGADHGFSYAKYPAAYERRVLEFFKKHLG